jgi:hypothetical protein
LKTVNCSDSSFATGAFADRWVGPPPMMTTGGPSPNRSNAMVVPSPDVTVFMAAAS